MGRTKKVALFYLALWISPVILTGCLGPKTSSEDSAVITDESPSPSPSSSLPVLVPGNALVAANDEAPIIRNQHGEPIRQDKESQNEVVHFDGFNEE